MAPNNLAANCSECFLAKKCIPSAIELKDLNQFTNIVTTNINLNNGDVLFKQGAPASVLYVVKSGAFKTQITTPSGAEHIAHFFLPGDIIGLDSAARGRYRNSATALEDSMVCKIAYRPLVKLRHKFPALSDFAVKAYSSGLASANETQNNIAIQAATSRLATFLIRYHRRSNQFSCPRNDFNLPMNRHDISIHLGLAVETISRSFTTLIKIGCITKEGKTVTIQDMPSLVEHANAPPR